MVGVAFALSPCFYLPACTLAQDYPGPSISG